MNMNMNIASIAKIINKGVSNYNEIKKQFQKSPKALQEISKRNNAEKKQKASIEIEINTQRLLDTISSQSTQSLKDWLLSIKEVNYLYEKTHIPPQYVFYIVSILLTIIIINYFSKAFTLIVGVIYPVHCSIRVMARFDWYDSNYKKHKLKPEEEKKRKLNLKKLQNWLEYWIVFFLLYNFELFFGSFLQKIPMYLFYKVIFLAILFLPWYKGAHYIYRSLLRETFRAYEGILYNFSLAVMEKIKEEIFIDKPKEQKALSSEEENPWDSTPDDTNSYSEDSNEENNNKQSNKNDLNLVKNIDNKFFKSKENLKTYKK